MKLFLSKMQKPCVIVLFLLVISISFSSCAEDDDFVTPNVENTIWRMVDNYLTNGNTYITQITFRDGYATYVFINRHTGVVDTYNDIIAHGRYYYDRHAGGFLIIDEKTGLPYKGVGTFRYENGLIMSGSTTYVLYK